ncbi:MAG TPA: ATP-binding cassette domain-containing protein [Thermoanaerobaculia bacterium]|nr:ATP-binding cassette domain-containing protein [Thermoanaerobaculia bacterium]
MTADPASTLPAIEARGIEYTYPVRRSRRGRREEPAVGPGKALAGLDFQVAPGEIYGFLGPNGGGKTTLFRILATLAPAERGTIQVFGVDLRRQAREVRRHLGVVFQNPSLDLQLTVAENLTHQGQLYGLTGRDLAARIERQMARFRLADRRDQRARELSGGLRRRAEIAKALLHEPRLLLLDEPSTGLDPAARRDLWDTLEELQQGGVTVLLTTHFMEEGDRCDRLALIDQGRLVAEGAPAVLKEEIGGDVVTLTGPDPAALARDLAARFPELKPEVRDGAVRLERERAHEWVARLVEALPGRIDALTVARPTLEDVFLHRTGHQLYSGLYGGEATP